MVEAAAFCAVRSTPAMVSLRVMMSANVNLPSRLWRMRCSSPFSALVLSALRKRHLQSLEPNRLDHEILGAGAHRRHHIVDAAMGGLHDHGNVEAGLADLGQHAHAVEAGHHQIEHHRVDDGRVRRGQRGDRGVAAVDHQRLIAAFLHHVFDQAALHGIVIGNQNAGGHGFPRSLQLSVLNRGTPLKPINALLKRWRRLAPHLRSIV